MTATTELIAEGPALALAALLDIEPPDLEADGLPPLWHWVYLLDHPATADLGPDGHALTGGVVNRPASAGGACSPVAGYGWTGRCGLTNRRRDRAGW